MEDKLLQAAKGGDLAVVNECLKRSGINANCSSEAKMKYTPLHWAVRKGHLEIVQTLLAAKADIEAKTEADSTPLHIAAWKGRVDIASLLMKHKAKVDARDNHGRTPLHVASYWGEIYMVALLLKNPHVLSLIDEKDTAGQTAVELATEEKHDVVVELLVSQGANLFA